MTQRRSELWTRRDLRVPKDDGGVFAVPALSDVAGELESNRALFEQVGEYSFQGRTLARLRDWARRDALRESSQFLGTMKQGIPNPTDGPWIVTGHQPELFHPGVWAKNFAIHALSQREGGNAVNLIIDSDLCTTRGVPVPIRTGDRVTVQPLMFDESQDAVPWENAAVQDEKKFSAFGALISREIARNWGYEPIARGAWQCGTGNPGDCFTRIRRAVEESWGITNHEVPISRLCGGEPFFWFVSHLLAHAPRFRDVHNSLLHDYRKFFRIRSLTHPVPDLDSHARWIETPFWCWRGRDVKRRGLYTRSAGDDMELGVFRRENEIDTFAKLRLAENRDACCAVEDLQQLAASGWRFRTRALTTTLFARLILADLFVHGIGGAKYDELTDRIIAQFFGFAPPKYLTLSMTVQLPLPGKDDFDEAALRSVRTRIRDLHFNPQKFIEGDHALLAERRHLVAEQVAAMTNRPQTRCGRRAVRRRNHDRYSRLREIANQLREQVADQLAQAHGELKTLHEKREMQKHLADRNYSWILHAEDVLKQRLIGLQIGA